MLKLPLKPLLHIAFVCALHEQSTPDRKLYKNIKNTNKLYRIKRRVYFSRGCESLMRGVVSEALASRKLVVGDVRSEGSETAKSGTDEQKRYMRHICSGKQPQHCKAQRIPKEQVCRCRRNWRKEEALTRGGLRAFSQCKLRSQQRS